jgi:spermidine/putrescine-binding protein
MESSACILLRRRDRHDVLVDLCLGAVERSMGDFTLRTNEFPGLEAAGPKGLPAGGNAAMLVSDSEDPEVLDAAWKFLKFITSGEGAADVARTTGYMPPNQAANEIILKDFYAQNPNKATAVRQLPLLRDWQAYPGDNGLAATQVIYDALEGIVTGEFDDMEELQQELVEEVNDRSFRGNYYEIHTTDRYPRDWWRPAAVWCKPGSAPAPCSGQHQSRTW